MLRTVFARPSLLRSQRPAVSSPLWRRLLHIETLTTPNDNALKYLSKDGELLQPRGSKSIVIKNTDKTLLAHSKLAETIFVQCPGVETLMIGDDFLTVNKDSMVHWNQITPTVIEILTTHLNSGEDVVSSEFQGAQELKDGGYNINVPKFNYTEDEEEISELIDELIDTRIRPAIMEDGGDIDYRGWDPKTGTVYLKLQGACTSCSSSEVTLKYGIESMLKHYVDEVNEVIQIIDPEQEIALKEFDKLEKKLSSKESSA
ncbi:similar to Saccharomyces cerevisiae YKL040C NFU1 Protein involved in iron metabolism in mitochondria [Maudiozyma saulgeensis]|uniref:Similar to Saccharomyces cerevisiae YKL040C NFU1 Protein involved in iron metabolism in mitochondria n=1 Tax=Maudiozyma saulgeensis TaxID=1789683 RepID=A0A1X7R843_9SACH|nr:similar to Saccharomyces cerevisiae YKL040C NFU1 Protein involved in iron metabolism in mitochondria [Kazachstania saulgeensis]